MLTWKDCVALCAVNEAEIDAIAEHEGIPETVALELGNYLCHLPDGEPAIRRMILDDMEHARRAGDRRRLLVLLETLKHFVDTHGPGTPKASRTISGHPTRAR